MQLPPPILVAGIPHLCYADLLLSVAVELFASTGIQTRAEYEQTIGVANRIASAYHFHIRCDLTPPTVPFGQHGIYLKQVKVDLVELFDLGEANNYFDKQIAVDLTSLGCSFCVLGEASKIPRAFFPMLDYTLTMPLQPQWAEHLWQAGQQHGLITLTYPITMGMRAYTVSPDMDEWQLIVQIGLTMGLLKIDAVKGFSETCDTAWVG